MHVTSNTRGAVGWLLLAAALLVAFPGAQAKTPDGWPFVEYNEAVRLAKRTHKPIFVYFGFPTCAYCEIANKNTFSVEALRKRYTDHYVLAYFDIRGNSADVMTLPDGEKLTRAEANQRLRSAPVPAWMFVSPEGREILLRRGSRTPVEAFMQFDQYISSNAYQRATFESFLAQRGWHEAKPPE
ncbi:MAG: thioredoxin family protein [Betaproteobacteria bacterium]